MKQNRIALPVGQMLALGHTDPADTDFVQAGVDMCCRVVCRTKNAAAVGMAMEFDQDKGSDFDFARMADLVDQTTADLDLDFGLGLDYDQMLADTVRFLGDAAMFVDHPGVDHTANQLSGLPVYTPPVALHPCMFQFVPCVNIQSSAVGRDDHVQEFHQLYLLKDRHQCLTVQARLLKSIPSHHLVAVADAGVCYLLQVYPKRVGQRAHQDRMSCFLEAYYRQINRTLVVQPS